MCDRKPDDMPSTSYMKRIRINEEEQQPNAMDEEAPNQLAIEDIPNNGHDRPQIFKLDVDCVQEMFDWLSIKDISAVSETCTRMQRIAKDYYETNLAAVELEYCYGGFRKSFTDISQSNTTNGFKEFTQKLMISYGVDDEGFRSIGQHCKSLKQINFYVVLLNDTKIGYIKAILSKIETVYIGGRFNKDFYANFLQFCPRLKHLRINYGYSKMLLGTSNQWLLRSYPTLQHLELLIMKLKVPELGIFLERNPSLQILSMNYDAFLININSMLQSKIKLEVLVIYINFRRNFDLMCHHLKQLYGRGFYQRLHIKAMCIDQDGINRFSSLNELEKLYLCTTTVTSRLNLNLLTNLNEFGFDGHFGHLETPPIDFISTAKILVNLERLYFRDTNTEMIEPFIEYSAKLKAIKIHCIKGGNFIALSAWNKKREQLIGARKVRIYLNDEEFVATKWNNKITDFKLIEVKRAESYDWKIPFMIQ